MDDYLSIMGIRKKKITLTVDAPTVEKAKLLGINISELTEKVLRGWVFDAEDQSRRALVDHYKAMFDTMTPMLKEYDTQVQVANIYLTYEDNLGSKPKLETITEGIHLQPDGQFWFDAGEVLVPFEKIRDDADIKFLSPSSILQNFIDALESGKTKRRERLESLEVARRLVEAIVKIESEPSSKRGSGPLRRASPRRRKHGRR